MINSRDDATANLALIHPHSISHSPFLYFSKHRAVSQVERIFDVFCEVSFPSTSTSTSCSNHMDSERYRNGFLFEDEFVPQDLIQIRRQSLNPRSHIDQRKPSSSSPSALLPARITYRFPSEEGSVDPDILKSIPSFAHPCHIRTDNVIHFTFVLTSSDSKWTFGFVRATTDQALLLLSPLPWNDTFFRILNHVHSLSSSPDVRQKFLSALFHTPLPDPPGHPITVTYCSPSTSLQNLATFTVNTFDHENRLPSVPEDRNLTEYLNACDPLTTMITMFASVLNERRILVTR